MTQLDEARKGNITSEIEKVARDEGISPEEIMRGINHGTIVIPSNKNHKDLSARGIGEGLRVKVNANIGTSPMKCNLGDELEKLNYAINAGTDAVMDLSTAGDIGKIRQEIIKNCPMPVGTVPIYQAVAELGGKPEEFTINKFLETFEQHARDGVDFATIHAGITRKGIELSENRLCGIVSRGGAFLASWMRKHNIENPLYTNFDEILEIAKSYDVTLSLGDGLRPGAISDASDPAQLNELRAMSHLAMRARYKGVQVMIEGPGHVPMNKIKESIELEKNLCNGAPFYVLGPIVTDIAPGYDHISSAIGAAMAAYYGADFICYVTPAEHLGLPGPKDVFDGVISARIATHAADSARAERYRKADDAMSKARYNLDWKEMEKYALDPEKIKSRTGEHPDVCSMCGDYCAIKIGKKEK